MYRKNTSKIVLYGFLIMGLLSFFSCKNFFNDTTKRETRTTVLLVFNLACAFNVDTGFYEKNHPEYMADFHFYPVQKGDKIFFDAKGYEYT